MKERYQATLVGCAIGDSLGMPVEGWKRQQIARYVGQVRTLLEPQVPRDSEGNKIESDEFGKIKCYTLGLKKGEWTDDTLLTLALAESITECRGLNLEDVAHRQMEAYEACITKEGKVVGGFGGTTMEALDRIRKGVPPSEYGVIGGPGNGTAMKISPLGIYMHATQKYEESIDFAEKVGKITHLDPRSIAGGIVQLEAINMLLNSISKENFTSQIYQICKNHEKPVSKEYRFNSEGSLASRLEWVNNNKEATVEEAFKNLRNSSKIYESYPFALFMFQKYWDNPIEGLIETINWGGDCDTTGAIYGALCGAKNGMIFPGEWKSNLKNLDYIISLGDKLHDLGNGGKR